MRNRVLFGLAAVVLALSPVCGGAQAPDPSQSVIPNRPPPPPPKPRPAPAPRPAAVPAPAPAPSAGRVIQDCSECPELVVIPAGRFLMGTPASEPSRGSDEGPQHWVTVPSLAVGKYSVTFDEWDACVAGGGCSQRPQDQGWGRGRRPVINVSWNDAQEYVGWLGRRTGRGYRLLTEAEWEYAARAGTTTAYYWGDEIGRGNANCYSCGSSWDGKQTAPVGSFPPNRFGLYDMAGNVYQWVQDCYASNYDSASGNASAFETNSCSSRVLRGGP